ncbi:MAG: hypothetical protein ACRDJE_10825 [Dehalococcoidia bacterium]
MMFELWNTESRNAVAEFETVETALGYVRSVLEEHGPDYPREWVLVVADDEDTQPIVGGDLLLMLATGQAEQRVAVSA